MSGGSQHLIFGDAPKRDAGAAAMSSPLPRVAIGDTLRAQITDTLRLARSIQKGEVKGDIASNFRFADDALLSIFSHWSDELKRLEKEIRAALPDEISDVLPVKGESQAFFVLNTLVLDFPVNKDPAKGCLSALILILENALDGRPNLFLPREVVDYCLPRRWTRRWWREGIQRIFQAIRVSLRGSHVPGRSAGAFCGLVPPAAPVPATPVPAAVPSKPACQCEICCNPS